MTTPVTFTANYSATDSAGNAVTGTVSGSTAAAATPPPPAPPVISSITVTPQSETEGAQGTLTVVATGGTAPLSCSVANVPGMTFAPVAGQPAGTFQFTFAAPTTAGVTPINVTVTDAAGNKVAGSASLTTTAPGTTWPTAATTGYGSTVLTVSSQTSFSKAGTYSGLSLTGPIAITASGVVLKNCLISTPNSAPWSMSVAGGLTGVVIQNDKIVGAGSATTQSAAAYGIYLEGDSQVTIDHCDISQCGQCVAINGGPVNITACYMHDLYSGAGTHYECIYYGGDSKASNFQLNITGNALYNQQKQTAVVYLENYFGNLQNVNVSNNLLVGGDYTVYVEGNQSSTHGINNIQVENNELGAGIYGYIDANKGTAPSYTNVTISGNTDYLTGAPVSSVANPN